MSVPAADSRIQIIASAGQTEFDGPVNAVIFNNTDVAVYQERDGSTELLTLTTDYMVTILASGFSITLTSAAEEDDIITIIRDVPNSRTDDYTLGGTFTGEKIDSNLNRLTVQISQADSFARGQTLHYVDSKTFTDSDTKLPILGPGQIFKKSETGSGIIAATIVNDDSTLRSDLANESPGSDGSRLVGYYDSDIGASTVHDVLPPLSSNIPIIEDFSDSTKRLYFDVSELTTSTNRTITVADEDIYLGQADETKKGLLEIATQAETNLGTDDTKAVTPEKLTTYVEEYVSSQEMIIAYARTEDLGELTSSYGLSVSRTSTGVYEYTFTNPLTSTDYLVVVTPDLHALAVGFIVKTTSVSTTGFTVETSEADPVDASHVLLVYKHPDA